MALPTRLAIVGSRVLAGNPIVWPILRRVLAQYQPAEVVSGGADGVDSMAAKVATDAGIPVKLFKPEVRVWDGGDQVGFKQRNLQIAGYCTHLVRIVARGAKTYGSGWTRDRVKGMGKPVEEVVVDA